MIISSRESSHRVSSSDLSYHWQSIRYIYFWSYVCGKSCIYGGDYIVLIKDFADFLLVKVRDEYGFELVPFIHIKNVFGFDWIILYIYCMD